MLLSYETIDQLIEAAGLDLEQNRSKTNADSSGDIMKTNPGDQGRQCNINTEER